MLEDRALEHLVLVRRWACAAPMRAGHLDDLAAVLVWLLEPWQPAHIREGGLLQWRLLFALSHART